GLLVTAQIGSLAAHAVLGPSGSARGTLLLIGVLYGGGLLCGALYAGLGLGHALLLFIAPLAARAVHPWERRLGPRWATLLQCLLTALPVAIVLVRLGLRFA